MGREHVIQAEILKEFGARPNLRIWRNNTGQSWTGNQIIRIAVAGSFPVNPGDVVIRKAHPLRFGLPGSADIFGVIQPAGRFVAIEVKSSGGKASAEQERFLKMVNGMGGLAFVAHSVEEVAAKIRG